eukprot:TRINITY_DN90269_c0_g1_i1.p2 TRINITY_DN90269_c0_g1~~TRINITY_DN90269_c0_g1_i1.p2  ORF type:complete len:185 (+),score=92.92 TRINITY_DN90269_c0_g1_i1:91-645(+)
MAESAKEEPKVEAKEEEKKELTEEEKAEEEKARKRAEVMAKVAAAKAEQQKKAEEAEAAEAKKKMIDEKGTSFYGDHAGITCDGCGIAPVFGYRFRCKNCPNHDICENCFDQWRGGKGVIANGLAKQVVSLKASDHQFYIHKDGGFKSMVSGGGPTAKSEAKQKPNDECKCGSGKKYKKCCMNK